MRALLPLLVAAICAACAAPAAFTEDGWSVQRQFDSRAPALLSISEVNAGSPPAIGELQATAVRDRSRGRYRIVIAAERSIAGQWTPGAALFDAEIERALDWLARLGAGESRAVELRLTLVGDHGRRQQKRLHPANKTLVIDLLVPVEGKPRSRSAALDAALATGLHEAAHALRPLQAKDRGDDEYRASLVAACFRLQGAQAGDRFDFNAKSLSTGTEFTRAHSASAAQSVRRDLAQVLGTDKLQGRDRKGLMQLLAHCERRLTQPAR